MDEAPEDHGPLGYSFMDSAPCGFVTFTDSGIIRTVNTTLRTLLGFGQGELEGKPITSLLSAGGRVFYQTHLFPTLKLQGKLEEIYISLKRHDGEDIPVMLNAVRRLGVRENAGETLNECILVTMRQRSRFEDELLQAKKVAQEANVALAKAHETLEAQQRELQIQQNELLVLNAREHRIAEVLQNALRPTISEEVPGLEIHPYYQPALDEAGVGGDFYDVFSLSSDCYALVVADLSGKGLAAASQVATVRHMLRSALYRDDLTVAQGVASLNDLLVKHGLLEGFATLFVGVYDVTAHTLTYVNAGQEPGLLLRQGADQVEELGPTGPVLGAIEGCNFSQRVTKLSLGDVFTLFTDGLTEAGTDRKDMLDVAGVSDIFRTVVESASETSQQISDRLMTGVLDAVTPAGIRDDVCLLVAQVIR